MIKTDKFYKATVEGVNFSFDPKDIDGLDLIKLSGSRYHLLKSKRSITAQLIDIDRAGKKISIKIEDQIFIVNIQDELDQKLERMGFGSALKTQLKEIKAPMPGRVLEVAVKEAQAVSKGDKLLTLEAMKMENSILAPADLRIKKILIETGQTIKKGDVLVELE